MRKILLIVALCAALAPVQAAPVSDVQVESAEGALPDLPHVVQDAIFAKMPLKERVRLSSLNKNFKHFGAGRKIADELHAENGNGAIKTAFDMDINNINVYDALLETFGPDDGNIDYAGQIAARRGNLQKLDEWSKKYRRSPRSEFQSPELLRAHAAYTAIFQAFPSTDDLLDAILDAAKRGNTQFLRRCTSKSPPYWKIRSDSFSRRN